MGWENIDDKWKRDIDAHFVSCDEEYELEYLKRIILEEFSRLSEFKIRQALEFCCNHVKPPRPRKKYLDCLKNILGEE